MIFALRAFALLVPLSLLGCSEAEKEARLADIIATFSFHEVDMAQSKFEAIDKLEAQDRASYAPVSFERARIRSNAELDGWHGPTIGNYYLAFETYRTKEEAERRATEYIDYERLSRVLGRGVDRSDITDLGKTTGRCWAYPTGNRVYLLTSHAAMQSALEARTNTVINGIKAYEKDLENKSAHTTPDPP